MMTNNHVIDGADEIYVKLSDGHEYLAKLVGTSPEVDIAILKVNANRTFKPLKFADSDSIKNWTLGNCIWKSVRAKQFDDSGSNWSLWKKFVRN